MSQIKKSILWYDSPVSELELIHKMGGDWATEQTERWQQGSLPIGNSFMGANIFGEIENDFMTVNQKTVWSGGPSKKRPDYAGGNNIGADESGKTMYDYYKEIRSLFLEEKDQEASELCNKLIGKTEGYGAYQAFFNLRFDFGLKSGIAKNYTRSLNLSDSAAQVSFDYSVNEKGTTHYQREYIASYPDDVIAVCFSAEGEEEEPFEFSLCIQPVQGEGSGEKEAVVTVEKENKTISLSGHMSDNDLQFYAAIKFVGEGITVEQIGEGTVRVRGKKQISIFMGSNTDYANKYPHYRTGETAEQLEDRVNQTVSKAAEKGYEQVKKAHMEDYQAIFERVNLNLLQEDRNLPTDQLLKAYNEGTAGKGDRALLEVLLFDYGRYLLISSSRPGDLPANLQGVWNERAGDSGYVPWSSDYHLNINLQMNYWPAYVTNMAECALPLIDYVESLREPGRVTAATYHNVVSNKQHPENGFVAHTQNTPFGFTCPGWVFSWGWSPAALSWILQNCYEYYEYTKDIKILSDRIYPMLKEAAVFYDQTLLEAKDGRLVSAPAFSPEHGPRTLGNTYEQSLVWQLYEDTCEAASILGVDQNLVIAWREKQSRLKPIEIGTDGQIKEWWHETSLRSVKEAETKHRHLSHLLGLFPGDLITVDNKEYMDAAIVSLTDRGDKSTGWGLVQRLNAWARTGDKNKPYQIIKMLFQDGIYPNLWDTHPPFQLDGNFGYTAGVAELLLQSNAGYLNILPALPQLWDEGEVSGLVARGNFVTGIKWKQNKAYEVTIDCPIGGECIIQAESIEQAIAKDKNENILPMEKVDEHKIRIFTEKGQHITITF